MNCAGLRFLILLPLLALGACASRPPVVPDTRYAPVDIPPAPAPGARASGTIYQAQLPLELFQDRKAYKVGDILTVVLSESTNASTSSSTSTKKSDALDMPSPTLFGGALTYKGRDLLETDIKQDRKFAGQGDSSQSNSLRGNLTVTVVRVLSNGNLLVRGEKIISINQGAEFVRLSGIVRPQDIDAANTVLSAKVANARIHYGGGGALADANTQGWLSRFFSGPYWPF